MSEDTGTTYLSDQQEISKKQYFKKLTKHFFSEVFANATDAKQLDFHITIQIGELLHKNCLENVNFKYKNQNS